MRMRVVDRRHFVCGVDCDQRLDPRMSKFWKSRGLSGYPADRSVVVTDGGRIVAFFRYLLFSMRYARVEEHGIHALGTYVLPDYRRRGIARQMWDRAISSASPRHVVLSITSRGARALIRDLSSRHPSVAFYRASNFR